jgi:hypothetical protein
MADSSVLTKETVEEALRRVNDTSRFYSFGLRGLTGDEIGTAALIEYPSQDLTISASEIAMRQRQEDALIMQEMIRVEQRVRADMERIVAMPPFLIPAPPPGLWPDMDERTRMAVMERQQEDREEAMLVEPPPAAPSRAPFHPTAPAVDDDYIALAAKLGVNNPKCLRFRLERFLAAEFVEVYPMKKVADYLGEIAARETRKAGGGRFGRPIIVWCWRPLRARDRGLDRQVSSRTPPWGEEPQNGLVRDKVYDKDVPYAALCTMDRITEEFHNDVRFFVSDYEARIPDPFLMVTADGLPFYVIERWDEPGFRS